MNTMNIEDCDFVNPQELKQDQETYLYVEKKLN